MGPPGMAGEDGEDAVLSAPPSPYEVTASAAFGTDLKIIIADGTGRGVKAGANNPTIDSSGRIVAPGNLALRSGSSAVLVGDDGSSVSVCAAGGVFQIGGGAAVTEARFQEGSGSGANYVGLKSPTTLSGNTVYELPGVFPSTDGVLHSSGSGVLTWSEFVPLDMLADIAYAINSLSNPSGSTLVANKWNVITASSACNAKLPSPAQPPNGRVIGVRITDGSTALFTLNPNNTEKIQPGSLSSRVMWAGESAVLIADGTDWYKVAGLTRPMICRIKNTASQNLTASAYTTINLGTVDIDNTGLMGLTSNTITIKRAGQYVIGEIGVVENVNTGQLCVNTVFINGTTGLANITWNGANSAGNAGGGGSIVETVAVADALTLQAFVGTSPGTPSAVYNASQGHIWRLWAVEVPVW